MVRKSKNKLIALGLRGFNMGAQGVSGLNRTGLALGLGAGELNKLDMDPMEEGRPNTEDESVLHGSGFSVRTVQQMARTETASSESFKTKTQEITSNLKTKEKEMREMNMLTIINLKLRNK